MNDHIKTIRRTKEMHTNWYCEQYPDVAMLGMDPAEHYLRYGAAMGRNPSKDFDTLGYLAANPDVAQSGMNPLLHYALSGKEEGRSRVRPAHHSDSVQQARKRIDIIRNKLLSLGFTGRPLAELTEIATGDESSAARALAANELALWHMRAKTQEGYRTALEHIAAARANAPNLDFRSRLATAELLCHYHLGQQAEGRAAYDRAALAGEVDPDVTLAWVNFQPTPEARIAWINQVLRRYGIAPVTLTDDRDLPPYDRLTCAAPLTKVTDGPLVSVLIAAYDAAEMLPTALRSLQEQSWQNLEIIVIDDCSPTPDTAAVAERFAAADPRIRVIRMPENGGAYVARNAGLDAATGTYVTLHDADDWSHPAKIETQVRFMEDNPKVMGCTSEQARSSEELEFSTIRSNAAFVIFNTSSFMFRRTPMREHLGYWDTARFGADNELIRRMRAVFGSDNVRRIPSGPLSFQRESASSVTEDPVKGIKGFYYGVRHEYFSAQSRKHENSSNLKYSGNPESPPFPRSPMMNARNRPSSSHVFHFDVIICADFRCATPTILGIFDEIAGLRNEGKKVGLVAHYDYDLETPIIRNCSEVYEVVDGERVRFIVFGEKASCKRLVGPDITNPANRQRYTPDVTVLG